MALIGNNADTLLNGLSSFWHRFFRDIKDIQVAYEGTEILLGQVYLDLLSDVLNTSVVEAPLFRKEYYKLITIREDQIVFKERGAATALAPVTQFYGTPGPDRFVYAGETFYGDIPSLQDTVFAPQASLETGEDYRVAGGEIHFKIDPTSPVLPGYAHRRVVVATGGQFTAASTDWVVAGVQKGDTLYYSEAIDLGVGSPQNAQDTARSATIIHVTATHLTVSVDTPFPTFPTGAVPSGFSWRIMRVKDDGTFSTGLPQALGGSAPFTDGQISYTATLEVSELSFWAVDAQVDDLTLYKTYGYFFTNPQLSTETYRSLIRGLMQLYILGPALARLESALNLTAGLPTIRSEGELLLAYDDGILYSGSTGNLLASDIFEAPSSIFTATSVGGFIKITNSDFANNVGTFNIIEYISGTQVRLRPGLPFTPDADVVWVNSQTNRQTVTTNANVYEYPLATPMRTDVVDPASVGVLTFRAFESVTTAIRVTDYVQDPEWWNNITIPQEIMPETPAARRVVTSQLYPNIVGPSGDAYVGDPGFYIGQDEEQQTVAYPQRHNAAFILMDRFLKLHMFAVIVDPSVSLTALLVTDLQKILKDVKPVHTALYFRPLTTFTDTVDITDYDVIVKPLRRQFEEITTLENDWLIGSAWNIGDTWKFTNLVGGVITINPGAGGIYVAVGGADPTIQPADPTNIPPGSLPDLSWLDRALYVYMH